MALDATDAFLRAAEGTGRIDTWVYPGPVFVRLGCGHSRIASSWCGAPGESYCCDVCYVMTTIAEVDRLGRDVAPSPWEPDGPLLVYKGVTPGLSVSDRWSTDPAEQIAAGMAYIRERYGPLLDEPPEDLFESYAQWKEQQRREDALADRVAEWQAVLEPAVAELAAAWDRYERRQQPWWARLIAWGLVAYMSFVRVTKRGGRHGEA